MIFKGAFLFPVVHLYFVNHEDRVAAVGSTKMASSLATAVYGVIAVWILANSILESDDQNFGLAGSAVVVIVAAAWPFVFLAWPILAWSIPMKTGLPIPD